MLTSLKFVQGAVGRKDFAPALTHFAIDAGRVRGYNGTMCLCSPIPLDVHCNPKAEPLIKAIASCNETAQLTMTAAGKLSIKSGAFKVAIDCIDGEVPHVEPEGTMYEVDGELLLKCLKVIAPVIGDDASRPWCTGVLFRGGSAIATNNVVIVEYWHGLQLAQEVNIPKVAVKELLRLNQVPTHIQVDTNSITFHFEGERWLRTQLFELGWPDVGRILDKKHDAQPVDSALFEGLHLLKPFLDKLGRVFIGEGVVTTHDTVDVGAQYEVPTLHHVTGIYAFPMLEILEPIVETIDLSTYPAPSLFFGENLRGAIIGIKK